MRIYYTKSAQLRVETIKAKAPRKLPTSLEACFRCPSSTYRLLYLPFCFFQPFFAVVAGSLPLSVINFSWIFSQFQSKPQQKVVSRDAQQMPNAATHFKFKKLMPYSLRLRIPCGYRMSQPLQKSSLKINNVYIVMYNWILHSNIGAHYALHNV